MLFGSLYIEQKQNYQGRISQSPAWIRSWISDSSNKKGDKQTMKTTMKKLGLSAAAAAAMLISTSANAGGVNFMGSTEFTQILNNGELAAQTLKQAQQYTTQIQQYYTQLQQYATQWQEWQRKIMGLRMMVQNIGQLPENMKNQFLHMAKKMKQSMEQGQAIAYTAANINQSFERSFKGYDRYLQQAQGGNLDFSSVYKNIYQTTKDTALNALKSLGIQERDLQNDQQFMGRLRQAMNSAQGTEAAIAVANQLAYHQTQSIQKLQKTVMTQANLQAEWIAHQNDTEAARQAQIKSMDSDLLPEGGGHELPGF
jgi:P-type conjugative transfer protein TrbJ